MPLIRIVAHLSLCALAFSATPAAALFEHAEAAVPSLNSARAVAFSGTTIYLGDGTGGVRSFDASDPSAPLEAGGVDTPGFVLGIAVEADRAFIADYRSGLRVLDISNPLAPFEIGSNADLGEVWSIAIVEQRAYLADESSGIRVVDLSNAAAPVEAHALPLTGCLDVAASEGKVYAACSELHILDASSASETRVLATLPLPGRAVSVVVSGTLAYVACLNQGIVLVDVSIPKAPLILAPGLPETHQVHFVTDLALDGDRLIVAERNFGLRLLDLSQPGPPAVAGSLEIAGSVDAVAASGSLAVVASGSQGLHLANIEPACLDGFDNDEDGSTDFPSDLGCSDGGDPSEDPTCSDGLDNDGDGVIDVDGDPGCFHAGDGSERTGAACDDGIDNDGDHKSDLVDPGCADAFDVSEQSPELVCDDGIDNDADGLSDLGDPECGDLLDFSESPRCSDGVDNDEDGQADYPDDPGCASPEDESERRDTTCDDGVDNDEDGAVDYPEDSGCSDLDDSSERNEAVACDDGIDNDGDGLVDFPADPGCESLAATLEEPACDNAVDDDADGTIDHPLDAGCSSRFDQTEAHDCSDGVDNDGDGAIDFGADFGCNTPGDASERSGSGCDDGVDNDADGLVDLDDPGCLSIHTASESPACDDGADNDGDGFVDFPEDPGCTGRFDETETGASPCDDGLDNDGDGAIDHPADSGCDSVADASELTLSAACDDGIDNDGDGFVDFPEDPECASAAQGFEAPACSDGIDNDGDGAIDGEDPGCADLSQIFESPACDDGHDNDGDGFVDVDDPQCDSASDLSEWLLNPADVVVVRPRSLARIDARSGTASVLASGGSFLFLGDVVMSEPGRLFVSDLALGSVFEVDADTGEQSELVSALDLGGSAIAVGGGIDVTGNGMLVIAAADGVYEIDPDGSAAARLIEGTPGSGFLGNFLDVTCEPEGTLLASRFATIDAAARFEVIRFDPATASQESLWSADPALGPGFNGSLALDPSGDLFVSQAGVITRLDARDGSPVGEAALSQLAGFGGIAQDVAGGLVVLEHCGPGGAPGCPIDGVRVVDAMHDEMVPGGAHSGMSLELIVVPQDCDDGLDGDGDALIDDADPDCAASFGLSEWHTAAAPEPAAMPLRACALAALACLGRLRRLRSRGQVRSAG